MDEDFVDYAEDFQPADSSEYPGLSDDESDPFIRCGNNSTGQRILFDPRELFESSEYVSDEDDDLPGLQVQSDSSDDEDELEGTPRPGEATEYDDDHSAPSCSAAYNVMSTGGPGESETELCDSEATRHICPH
jgi:hypothetical protein